jgi:ubiquinone/menaquinone biosynthesis C-methylase UbiE
MAQTERTFLPAAGHDRLLPLYDPLTRLLGVDDARKELVGQAGLQPLHRVLDIGCGTGTLAILVKSRYPHVDVTGLDPDPKALARARRKALRSGVMVRFDRGFSESLPYDGEFFDRVFSSMMLHHLDSPAKERTLREVLRVLEPGGRLLLLDVLTTPSEARSGLARWLPTHERLKDNTERHVIDLMTSAGFVATEKVSERRVLFATLAYYRAVRPL